MYGSTAADGGDRDGQDTQLAGGSLITFGHDRRMPHTPPLTACDERGRVGKRGDEDA
jgi:hypothetical protein